MAGTPRSRMTERRLKLARKHKLKTFLLSAGIIASSLLFYTGFNFNVPFVNQPQSQIQNDVPTQIEQTKKISEPINIILMGVDERKDDVGRSDTLMIASVDSNNDSISLLSIPRDTRVKINRHGYDKINAAYAYGGEKLAQKTVESFLGIDINHYVIVNTNSFADMIDAIGGVDIDVEKDMYYEDPWDDNGGLVIDLKPGLQHMNGKTAITYVRYRDDEGDIGRVRRQQQFIKACLDKLSSPSTLISLPQILTQAKSAVKTDLSISQMVSIAQTIALNDDNLKTGTVPGHLTYIDGVSYLIPNIERLGEVVTKNLHFDTDEKYFIDMAYEYENSIPSYVTEFSDEYDVNVNKSKDRDLIDYLAELQYQFEENRL